MKCVLSKIYPEIFSRGYEFRNQKETRGSQRIPVICLALCKVRERIENWMGPIRREKKEKQEQILREAWALPWGVPVTHLKPFNIKTLLNTC